MQKFNKVNIRKIPDTRSYLSEYYLAICLFFALIILTLAGVGNVVSVSLLGVLLCLAGVVQGGVTVDLWVLIPLILYNLFSCISSYLTFGNTVEGYAATQMIFPVLYLLLAYLSRRELILLRQLCIAWVGFVAILGICQFVYSAVWLDSAKRLGGLLGNPNGFGIFLVIGWFALLECLRQKSQEGCGDSRWLYGLEPLLFISLGLTLSMGSFLSMAMGILILLFIRKRQIGWHKVLLEGSVLLSRVIFGIAIGVLLYLGVARTNHSWVCLLIFIYALFMAWYWQMFVNVLMVHQRLSCFITACGLLLVGVAIGMRPSALATFAERLAMMKNGIGYLGTQPLWGVGPYQWRVLNLYDSDIYFNTNHIHNAFIHVGVELGLVAMVMLMMITVRGFVKKRSLLLFSGFAAFFLHSLMDTGFFYLGIVALFLLTIGEPAYKGRRLSALLSGSLLGGFAVVFLCNLIWYVRMV